jgi:Fis family transcriptional regulator
VSTLRESASDHLKQYFAALGGTMPAGLYDTVLDQVEPPLIRQVLTYCRGSQTRAANALGLNRATLRKKMQRHGISVRRGVVS